MKSDQLLRAISTVLLMTLNIIGGSLVSTVKELKNEIKTVNTKIQDLQIRLYGAEKDISLIQKYASSPISTQASGR